VSERRLVELSVAEFVEAVASTDQPAPAGGSVLALAGAGCAALLELVCGVRQAHTPGVLERERAEAQRLRRELLALIDEDAAAVGAWLAAPPGSDARRESGRTASAVPLRIAGACSEVVTLSRYIEVDGAVRFDVRAAERLATAAALAALDLVEANLRSAADRGALQDEIARLRASLGGSAAR
jgi:formiminotetrahydrofolate cyclodeaminase